MEFLEKQQALNMEKFKQRAKELKSTVTKELEEATLDAAGLRRLIHIKNKELKHMKALAATILSQRTETEQFFLEALQEVKEVIRQERKQRANLAAKEAEKAQQTQATEARARNTGTTFPPLNIKAANMHLLENTRRTKPEISLAELEKVTIGDLCWEDKELVLRVLFSKMNGVGPANTRPNLTATRMSSQMPVFISEGAGMGTDVNLRPFEVESPRIAAEALPSREAEDDYYSVASSGAVSKVMLPTHQQQDHFLNSLKKPVVDDETSSVGSSPGKKRTAGQHVRIAGDEGMSLAGQSVSSLGSASYAVRR